MNQLQVAKALRKTKAKLSTLEPERARTIPLEGASEGSHGSSIDRAKEFWDEA